MNDIHIERMDLNLLVVWQAIYQEGGITQASRRLHLTQSAVSHALRRLRRSLGDPLFVRHGARTVPTPLTLQLMDRISGALAGLQAALSSARRFDPADMPRTFRVGMRSALEPLVLPRLCALVLDGSPRSHLHTLRIEPAHLSEDLATGTLDCAVDIPMRTDEAVRQERLAGSNPLCVLAHPHHPAMRGGDIGLDAYLRHAHVAVSTRRSGLTMEDAALERLGLRRHVVLRVQTFAVAMALAAHHDLLVTVPVSHVGEAMAHGLVHRPLPFDVPPVEYRLYWHRHRQEDPALAWLRGRIAQAFVDAAPPMASTGRVR
jgi:DNA-binding transcriptional LysR family regulator